MPLILGTNSIKDTGYNVANSLRFNDGSSDYLSGPNTNAGSTKTKFTFSAWVKRANITPGNDDLLIGKWSSGNDRGHINFSDSPDDCISFFEKASGSTTTNFKTSRLFRDPSAWFHVVFIGDTTQGTESNRLKIYINGAQETSFSTATYPSQSYEWQLQAIAKNFGIGAFAAENAGASPSSFYLAEVVYLDGTAASIGDLGEFDSDSPNIWKPIDVSGLTFGTNGFYLDFENASSLGADVSGNGNNFTVNNLTSIDQTTDTCTNNFATINPLSIHPSSTFTISEGNLQFATSSSTRGYWISTFGVSSGKWYWEYKVTNNQARTDVGIAGAAAKGNNDPESGVHDNVTVYLTINGQVNINSNSSTDNFYNQATSSNNIIIGTALDLDSSPNTIAFSIDGEWVTGSGTKSTTFSSATKINSFTNVASTVNGVYHFIAGDDGGEQDIGGQANFGNPPFSISSGKSDANGFGNFDYAVPSGYYSLNTKNLAENG